MSRILALDTSNYTTSACILDTGCGIVWESRIPVPVEPGKCGVRQSDAVFHHVQNLAALFEGVPVSSFDAVAASDRPSERENSYMPCFTVGVSFAKSVADLCGVPVFFCSHQKNHIMSAAASVLKTELVRAPLIAYHVSGGTTDIMICRPEGRGFSVTKIGGTADISCGQLIDRTGTMLGFPFPCGKEIEHNSSGRLTGGIKIKSTDGSYNFSGFQNKLEKMKNDGAETQRICDAVLDTVYSFLLQSSSYVRERYGDLPILFSGGVMSNTIISKAVKERLENVYFSKPEYSVDNASGTAFLCAAMRGELDD